MTNQSQRIPGQRLGLMSSEDDMFSDKFTSATSSTPTTVTNSKEFIDDSEGFLVLRPGDTLDTPMGRFHLSGLLGKGTYGAVYKSSIAASKLGEHGVRPQAAALKVHRANPVMYRAGTKEADILQRIKEAETEHERDRFIVGFLGHFDFYTHSCLAYELLEMSARALLERYGKDRGLSLKAVQTYTRQICAALHILNRCKIIHGDIKPENILISSQLNTAKLCDFGTAMKSPCTEFVPYLASRFYRSPEIILGNPISCETDIWSLGCTLYELYTGRVLFPGHSNGEMLLLMVRCLGRLSTKMIKSAQAKHYFPNGTGSQLRASSDHETGSKELTFISTMPSISLSGLLKATLPPEEDEALYEKFTDFIEKLLVLSPDRRFSPAAALAHPFLK